MSQNSIFNSTTSDNCSRTLPEPESLTPKENHTHCFWLIGNDDLKSKSPSITDYEQSYKCSFLMFSIKINGLTIKS